MTLDGPIVDGQVTVEYSGGPFDGQRQTLPPKPDPRLRVAPSTIAAGLVGVDRSDAEVAAHGVDDVVGIYHLVGPTSDGLAYRYEWRPGAPDGLESGADAGGWVTAPWDAVIDGTPALEPWLWHRVARGEWPRWSTWCQRTVVHRGERRPGLIRRDRPTERVCPACGSVDSASSR
jgi:hypothetical protein